MDPGKRYDGFISYSHAADGQLAPRLQAGAQRFAKPWWRRRALLVFRDETGLSVNPHLWGSISEALDDSRWFILLCSPESAQSPWVDREIRHWREHHDPARILPVLTDGEWEWDASSQSFDAESTAVPPALWDAFDEEPRHLDLRWAREAEQLNLRNGRFRTAVAELAAPMRGVPREELESEEIRVHRRAVRLAWSAAIVLVVLSMATAVAAVAAVRNAEAARVSAAEATDKSRQADSTRLGALAADEATHGLPDRALLLAVAAMDAGGADTNAARNALLGATGNTAGLERVLTDGAIEPGTVQLGVPILALGPDGGWAALADGAPPTVGVVPPISIIDRRSEAKRVVLQPPPETGTVIALQPVAADRLVVVSEKATSTTPSGGLAPDMPVSSDLPTDGPSGGLATSLPDPAGNASAGGAGSTSRRVQLFDVRSAALLYDEDAVAGPQLALGGTAMVVPQRDALELVEVASGRPIGTPWPGRIATGSLLAASMRAPTNPARVVSADGGSLVGFSPTSGAQVRWDLRDPAAPVALIPGSDAALPPIRLDPSGARVAGVTADGTVVAMGLDGAGRVEGSLGGARPTVAFAVGPQAERVVAVDDQGTITTADLGGSGPGPAVVACDPSRCAGSALWTAETSRDAAVVVVTRTPTSALPDVDSRSAWFVNLRDATVTGPLVGGPVAFQSDPQTGPSGVTMSVQGFPPMLETVYFGEGGGRSETTTGLPIVSADGAFVALPATAVDTGKIQETWLHPTDGSRGVPLAPLAIPYGSRAQAFAVDEEHVVGAAADAQLYIWNRKALSTAMDTNVWPADISADGNRIAQATAATIDPNAMVVELYDAGTGQKRTFAPPGGSGTTVRFDPSGRWLAATPTGNAGNASWVLDTLDGRATPQPVAAEAIVFSEDGQTMAAWQRDGQRWKATVGPVPGGAPIGSVVVDDAASSVPGLTPDSGVPLPPPVSALRSQGGELAVRTRAGVAVYGTLGGPAMRTLALPASATPNDVVFTGGSLRSIDTDHGVTQVRAWAEDNTLSGVAEITQQSRSRLVSGPDGLILVVDERAPAGTPGALLVGASLSPIGNVDRGMMRFSTDGRALNGVASGLGIPPERRVRPIDLDSLRALACATAGRELTKLEWARFLPGVEQTSACAATPGPR